MSYSLDELRTHRARAAAPATGMPPADAPWPDDLVLAFWADWRGEFVSPDEYWRTIPIDRLRGEPSNAGGASVKPSPQVRPRRTKDAPPLLEGFQEV